MLEAIKELAIKASVPITAHFQSEKIATRKKPDGSPITDADLESDEIIREGLTKLDQKIPIVSEEGSIKSHDTETFWLVDPLDGTRDFAAQRKGFTVNIALISHREPILATITAPAFNEVYCADKNSAVCFKLVGDRKVEISSRGATKDLVAINSFSFHQDETLTSLGFKIEKLGSSLKFCRLAEAMADLYFRQGETSEWDTAAGQCILECAGGKVLDLQGNPLTYQKANYLNPPFIAVGDPSKDWLKILEPLLKIP